MTSLCHLDSVALQSVWSWTSLRLRRRLNVRHLCRGNHWAVMISVFLYFIILLFYYLLFYICFLWANATLRLVYVSIRHSIHWPQADNPGVSSCTGTQRNETLTLTVVSNINFWDYFLSFFSFLVFLMLSRMIMNYNTVYAHGMLRKMLRSCRTLFSNDSIPWRPRFYSGHFQGA